MSRDLATRTFGRGRRAAIFLNVVVMVVLAVAAAVIGTYLTGFTDFRRRYDLTRAETYTLRPDSARLVAALESDVEIITITDPMAYIPDVDQVRPKAMEYVVDLLQEYKVRSRGRISVENLDYKVDFDRVRDLFREYNLTRPNVVIVRSGDNRRILGLDTDLAQFDPGSPPPAFRATSLIAYTTEEALSSALFEVTETEQLKAYAVTGHGEASLADGSDMGGSYVAATLSRDNIDVQPLSLLAIGEVPEDAGAVLLIGPKKPFMPEEIVALDAYLKRGGRLLVASDPLGDRSLDEGLYRQLGLVLERNIMCHDQGGTLLGTSSTETWAGPARMKTPATYARHEITRTLIDDGVVTVWVRSGGVAPAEAATTWFTTLVASHPDTFGDIPGSDAQAGNYMQDPRVEQKGQRCLAAALEPGGDYQGARLVFVPSAAWITNQVLVNYEGNDTFLRRSVAWLVGKKKSIVLPPTTPRINKADLRPGEDRQIMLYTAGYLPLGALLLAFVVWFARRR